MIGMMSYRCDEHGWVGWKEVTEREGPGGKKEYVHEGCPRPLKAEYFKMSKTRGNLVSASEMGDTWGVDVQRLYTLAVGPAEQDAEWIEQGVVGYSRFLRRAFNTLEGLTGMVKDAPTAVDAAAITKEMKELRRKAHETILRVSAGLELDREGNFGFHTAIAGLIELEQRFPDPRAAAAPDRAALREAVDVFVRLLAPFAPHVAEELWQVQLGRGGSVFLEAWPEADPAALVRDEVEIAVQIQGKPKAKAMVPPDADEAALREIVLAIPKVQEELAGKTVRKFIVVKKQNVNNLVNIVAG
jgi:leucyl-tRNA synthetase